ncbi:MAG: DNA-binding transcriptional regulator [Bacillota bacterium]|nr:MAG: DNA-binding transcriptional regulator [Bacillota bacterium]
MQEGGVGMQRDDRTTELLVRCAWLYYEEGLTQQEIAHRLGVSRLRVNRLLKQARETGIVHITIQHPGVRLAELEGRLIHHFRIPRAVVIPTPVDGAQLKRVLGKAAATYLERALRPGDCLGVTWGTTLLEVAQQLTPRVVSDLRVVQITGGLTPDLGEINPFDIARRVADAFGARCFYLYAPMFLSRAEVCDALMAERFIAHVLEQARNATHILTSVGEMEPTATFRQVGYLDEETFSELIALGAVGSMFARFFDALGRPVRSELDRRTVALRLEDLHAIEDVIVVAGGPAKVRALLGALRGGYVKTLITDAATARALLAADGAPDAAREGST